MNDDEPAKSSSVDTLIDRHLKAGWWGLAVFIALGAALELLHAVKSPFYVDAGQETTRLLLRLAHAHGTLVSMVNLAYAFTLSARREEAAGADARVPERARPQTAKPLASVTLLASLILLPGGFFLGALWAHGGDPGLGVILVPVGALALFVAAILIARSRL